VGRPNTAIPRSRPRSKSSEIGDHRDWFERLYVAADDGELVVPWDRSGGPHRLLNQWARQHGLVGADRSAIVVGCGLGGDAEYLARLGFATVGFDFAATAIRTARERFPNSHVDYHVADLLDPPGAWFEAFDFVFESLTVQSLPRPFRMSAVSRVRQMVAPGGTLLVLAAATDQAPADDDPNGGPWPLTRAEIESFASGDLRLVSLEDLHDPDARRWRAELHRAG
jgi:SAM-dependent methyltransferase